MSTEQSESQEQIHSLGETEEVILVTKATISKENPKPDDHVPAEFFGNVFPVQKGERMNLERVVNEDQEYGYWTTGVVESVNNMSDGSLWVRTRNGSVYRIKGTVQTPPKAKPQPKKFSDRIKQLFGR